MQLVAFFHVIVGIQETGALMHRGTLPTRIPEQSTPYRAQAGILVVVADGIVVVRHRSMTQGAAISLR
jgi:hypothetical protein